MSFALFCEIVAEIGAVGAYLHGQLLQGEVVFQIESGINAILFEQRRDIVGGSFCLHAFVVAHVVSLLFADIQLL